MDLPRRTSGPGNPGKEVIDIPMVHANCTSTKCKLCFRDRYFPKWEHALPSYMRSTTASRKRHSLNLRDQQEILKHHKGSPPRSPPKSQSPANVRLSLSLSPQHSLRSPSKKAKKSRHDPLQALSILLRFPPEIRCRIYEFMMMGPPEANRYEKNANEADGVVVWGSVVGGGAHEDKTPTGTWINASKSFYPEILTINKQIYHEAVDHIYKRIPIDLYVKNERQGARLQYWLRQHPVRFTRELSVYFSLDLQHMDSPNYFRPKRQERGLWDFASYCRALPNLQKLIIQLIPTGVDMPSIGATGTYHYGVDFMKLSEKTMRRYLAPLAWFKPDFKPSDPSADPEPKEGEVDGKDRAAEGETAKPECNSLDPGEKEEEADKDPQGKLSHGQNSSNHSPNDVADTRTQTPSPPSPDATSDSLFGPSPKPAPSSSKSPTPPSSNPQPVPSYDFTLEILLASTFRYDRAKFSWAPPQHMMDVLQRDLGIHDVQRIFVGDDTKYFSVGGATWELNPGRERRV